MPASEPVARTATEETAITTSTPELGNFGIDLSSQDSSVQPGDDFFRFANGMWLDNFNLPADRSSYGSFTVLSDRSDQYVRVIIDDLSSAEPAVGSIEQKI
ncbi:MAG: M13 family peptidase, partial [Pseudomonadota bacterium]|nr:M13 family peptidase [Pseudomonadota bacterium]